MTLCPSGRGAVPTGYRTTDLDLAVKSHARAFRCLCGAIHSWNEEAAWAERAPSSVARQTDDPQLAVNLTGGPGG